MADSVSPVSRITAQRRAGRRTTDPLVAPEPEADAAPAVSENLPVPVTPPPPTAGAPGAYEAQLLGQDGQKRGLRGGKPVLDQAKSAYLGAEWSGPYDRRPPQGLLKKTTI